MSLEKSVLERFFGYGFNSHQVHQKRIPFWGFFFVCVKRRAAPGVALLFGVDAIGCRTLVLMLPLRFLPLSLLRFGELAVELAFLCFLKSEDEHQDGCQNQAGDEKSRREDDDEGGRGEDDVDDDGGCSHKGDEPDHGRSELLLGESVVPALLLVGPAPHGEGDGELEELVIYAS